MDLITLCLTAFVGVFVLLTLLAGVMQAITLLFPSRQQGVDAVTVAAITSAMQRVLPGTRVIRIEEKS